MNSSTPFSATQQRLILCAAVLFVLVACGNLVKNYHPRFRRGPIFRYTPLGLLVLASVVATECIIVIHAIYLVPRHPLWFPAAAVFGLLVFFVCARVDELREKASARSQPTASKQWQLTPQDTVRLALWYTGALAFSLVTVPFSLYGELFGPQRGILLAIIAFVLSLSVFLLSRHPLGARFLKECPTGLAARLPELSRWRKLIERLLMTTGLLAFLAVALMLTSSGVAGVPADSLPAFATREHCMLTNHGKRTEVSAPRFWVAASAGSVAWHAGTLFATLLALYALLYGELPPQFRRSIEKTKSKFTPS